MNCREKRNSKSHFFSFVNPYIRKKKPLFSKYTLRKLRFPNRLMDKNSSLDVYRVYTKKISPLS